MEVTYAIQCTCGAVTVDFDKENYSMTEQEFKDNFPDTKLEEAKYQACNHCTNNWGISLCYCGSGEHVNTCKCGCNKPAQVISCYQHP